MTTGAADSLQRFRRRCKAESRPLDWYDYVLPFTNLSTLLQDKVLRVTTSGNPRRFGDVTARKVITVVGSGQVGKTWVLNQILGTNLPIGRGSEGLSVLGVGGLTVIDSPGLMSWPRCGKLEDAQRTEAFLLSLLCELSQLCILVVDKFGPTEAGYLQSILSSTPTLDCIVVHNMSDMVDRDLASTEFQRRLRTLQVDALTVYPPCLLRGSMRSHGRHVEHVGLCREDCIAVNEPNASYLRQLLDSGGDMNVKLVELLSSRLASVLTRFVHKVVSVQHLKDTLSPLAGAEYPWVQYISESELVVQPSEEVDESPSVAIRSVGDRRTVEISCPGAHAGDITVARRGTGISVRMQWPPGMEGVWQWTYTPPPEEGVWSFDSTRFKDGVFTIQLRAVAWLPSPSSSCPLSPVSASSVPDTQVSDLVQSPSLSTVASEDAPSPISGREVSSAPSEDAFGFHLVANEPSEWVLP